MPQWSYESYGVSTQHTQENTADSVVRDAQRTHFRKPLDYDTARVNAVEQDLAKIIKEGALKAGETSVVRISRCFLCGVTLLLPL